MAALQYSEYLEDNYDESGFTNRDVSMSNGKLPNGHSPIDISDESSVIINASTSENSFQNKEANISIISID